MMTQPSMPMQAAYQSTLPSPPMAGSLAGPPGALPMPPAGAVPPQGPPPPQWQVKMQPDGTSVYFMPGPKGDGSDDLIMGVNPPPKQPKGAQPPAAQGVPLALQMSPPQQ